MLHACSTRRRRSSSGVKLAARMAPACTRSLSSSRYSANTMPSRIESVRMGHLAAGLRHDAQRLVGAAHGVQAFARWSSRWRCPRSGWPAHGKVRDGLRRHGRSFRYAGDDGGARDLNSPPTNEVSAASAKVTAVIARMTQMGRRVLIASALLVWGNQRDSAPPL